MRGNFSNSVGFILQTEGGFVNNPNDPGGATNKGVTQKVYDAYRARYSQPKQSVKLISEDEAESIYKQQYWDAVHGDDLPYGIDYAVTDFAVNSGVVRAASFLQRILGVTADGHIGLITLNALNPRRDYSHIIDQLCDARQHYLESLDTFVVFGRGWTNRVLDVRKRAKGMVR